MCRAGWCPALGGDLERLLGSGDLTVERLLTTILEKIAETGVVGALLVLAILALIWSEARNVKLQNRIEKLHTTYSEQLDERYKEVKELSEESIKAITGFSGPLAAASIANEKTNTLIESRTAIYSQIATALAVLQARLDDIKGRLWS